MKEAEEQLVKGIERYFKKAGATKAVLGLSGGVDSSLVLKLAVDALGPEKITALIMPETGVSRPENTNHAKKLCQFLKVRYFVIAINKYLLNLEVLPWQQNLEASINIRARVRMMILYNYANANNALVLGTSNKSEILLGYGTKYGDLAADLEVIGDLFKTEVKKLARGTGLPDEIVEKAPSAELYKDQTDEKELGFPYSKLDQVLAKYKDGKDALIDKGMDPRVVHLVFQRIERNKHKTQAPPVIKIK